MACKFHLAPRIRDLSPKRCPRENIPIISRDREVFVVLVGRPNDETYKADLILIEQAMQATRGNLSFPKGSTDHRRGRYPHISTGVSYGGGAKARQPSPPQVYTALINPQRPGDLRVGSSSNQRLVRELEGHRGMKRLVGFVKSKLLQTIPPSNLRRTRCPTLAYRQSPGRECGGICAQPLPVHTHSPQHLRGAEPHGEATL